MKNSASEIKDLVGKPAIDKFKEIVKHEQTCLFSTDLGNVPIMTRPMGVQKVCDQGNFWFMSPADSDKNQEIAADPRVQLFISNTKNYEFLSVYGHATISRDQAKIDEFFNAMHKAWFPEGKEDPNI